VDYRDKKTQFKLFSRRYWLYFKILIKHIVNNSRHF